MKSQWKTVVLITLLLGIQAVCDLALPTYTSGIIDTGIQNSGIEYATPLLIRGSEYEKLKMIMSESELSLWESSYTLEDDSNYHLKDSSPQNMAELDKTFTTPIAILYMMEQSEDLSSSETEASIVAERVQLEKKIQSMGSALIHSSAIDYIKNEYAVLGVDTAQMQTSYLWATGGRMLLMALVMTVAIVLVCLLSARVGSKIGHDLREKIFTKIVSFSSIEMNHFSTASLITRSSNDIQQIQMVSIMILRMIFYAPIIAIGSIFMVLRTGGNMEWIIGIAVAAILSLVITLMSIAMPKFKLMQILIDRVNLVAREILTGLSVIRAFGRENNEEERFDEANQNLTKTMLFANRVMTFMMPMMMFIMNGISILIIWVASNRIDAGNLEVGSMTAFISYTMQIVIAFLMLSFISIMLPRAVVAANRVNEVINTKVSIIDNPESVPLKNCTGCIVFTNVNFKYPGAKDYTLQNISFEALPGKITAIVGSTGSGKSTLAQLIPRFYDINDGSILLDGLDIRNILQKDLRTHIGFVPQKGVLFSGTIAENIRYGARDASDDEMETAASIAQATDFIEEKTDKYASRISQGGNNVSGGQKQRLAIARAIALKAPIYIFDDSFSALDFKTDAALRKALSLHVKDSTVIIVAGRISTVLHSDQILVLDEGRLVGKGTHTELMEDCETYQQIAKSQLSESELLSGHSEKEGQ